jgi:hypothetical protein
MQRTWRLPAVLWIAIFTAIAAYAAWGGVTFYSQHLSMDLYHPWGVPLAHESLGRTSNPYADTGRYGAYLDGVARASASEALHWVREFWERRNPLGIEPTGTPLYYASLAFTPRGFDDAHLLFTLADFAAAALAVFMLARLRGAPLLPAACIAALVIGTYNPFIQDIRAGNVTCVQLLVLAAMIAVAQRKLWERHSWMDRSYLAILAVFLLFKPNTLFVVAGLAAHYLVARGTRAFATGSAIALLVAFAGAAYGAWYFGAAGVWSDWLRYTQGMNGGTLVYALAKGNTALPVMLAERGGAYGPTGYAVLLAAAFAFGLLACASSLGRDSAGTLPALRAWFADPWAAASIGTLAMFVASPLLWRHYFMFALIPMAWLARPDKPRDAAVACAVLSFFLFSRMLLGPLAAAGLEGLAYLVIFFSWAPLLPAALARLARMASTVRSA